MGRDAWTLHFLLPHFICPQISCQSTVKSPFQSELNCSVYRNPSCRQTHRCCASCYGAFHSDCWVPLRVLHCDQLCLCGRAAGSQSRGSWMVGLGWRVLDGGSWMPSSSSARLPSHGTSSSASWALYMAGVAPRGILCANYFVSLLYLSFLFIIWCFNHIFFKYQNWVAKEYIPSSYHGGFFFHFISWMDIGQL